MLEILKYIFSSGWIFIGVLILISTIGVFIDSVIGNVCRAIIGSKDDNKDKEVK